jgi:hypothetical protein
MKVSLELRAEAARSAMNPASRSRAWRRSTGINAPSGVTSERYFSIAV